LFMWSHGMQYAAVARIDHDLRMTLGMNDADRSYNDDENQEHEAQETENGIVVSCWHWALKSVGLSGCDGTGSL